LGVLAIAGLVIAKATMSSGAAGATQLVAEPGQIA